MYNTVWTSVGAFLVLYFSSYTYNCCHYNFLFVNNCFKEQLIEKIRLRKKSSKYISSFQLLCAFETFQHLHWEKEVWDDPSLHLGTKWYVWERKGTILQLQLNITYTPMFQNRCCLLQLIRSACIPFQIPREKNVICLGKDKILLNNTNMQWNKIGSLSDRVIFWRFC